MKHYKVFYFACGLMLLASCYRHKEEIIYSAYKPVLMETSKVTTEVKLLPDRDNKNIVLMRNMGNYLLALDYGLGIHIIDATDNNHPVKRGFFQIPACIDFEVRNNTVYANNYLDFIMIDFTDMNNPVISKREAGTFDINIKSPDGLSVHDKLNELPSGTTIISYEKI